MNGAEGKGKYTESHYTWLHIVALLNELQKPSEPHSLPEGTVLFSSSRDCQAVVHDPPDTSPSPAALALSWLRGPCWARGQLPHARVVVLSARPACLLLCLIQRGAQQAHVLSFPPQLPQSQALAFACNHVLTDWWMCWPLKWCLCLRCCKHVEFGYQWGTQMEVSRKQLGMWVWNLRGNRLTGRSHLPQMGEFSIVGWI